MPQGKIINVEGTPAALGCPWCGDGIAAGVVSLPIGGRLLHLGCASDYSAEIEKEEWWNDAVAGELCEAVDA